MSFAFTPTGASSATVVIGIDHLLSSGNYIIQSENITKTAPTLQIQDQKGRTAQVIAYDIEMNCNLTAIGPNTAPVSVGDTWSWYDPAGGSQNYIVTSVERAATYNDTAKWNIQATAYVHAAYVDKTDDSL